MAERLIVSDPALELSRQEILARSAREAIADIKKALDSLRKSGRNPKKRLRNLEDNTLLNLQFIIEPIANAIRGFYSQLPKEYKFTMQFRHPNLIRRALSPGPVFEFDGQGLIIPPNEDHPMKPKYLTPQGIHILFEGGKSPDRQAASALGRQSRQDIASEVTRALTPFAGI